MRSLFRAWLVVAALATAPACSLKTYAINMVGDALSAGDSVYQTDDDLELVGAALPFGLKLTESLLAQSPNHPGLLLTACRGFTVYPYAYIGHAAEIAADDDLDRARVLRLRARRLYFRAFVLHPWARAIVYRPHPRIGQRARRRCLGHQGEQPRPRGICRSCTWSAASLGLAISVSKDDAAMLGRLPEVRALLDRALTVDESWDAGALHEFRIVLAAATPVPRTSR